MEIEKKGSAHSGASNTRQKKGRPALLGDIMINSDTITEEDMLRVDRYRVSTRDGRYSRDRLSRLAAVRIASQWTPYHDGVDVMLQQADGTWVKINPYLAYKQDRGQCARVLCAGTATAPCPGMCDPDYVCGEEMST